MYKLFSILELKSTINLKWKMSLTEMESYGEAIKPVKNNSDENVPVYLSHSNRSAAYIQDKNYYSEYEDAKQSLKF